MKKAIFAILVLFTSYNAFSGITKQTPVVVLNTSHDVFYFKICKSMIGGTVEVYGPDGKMVANQNLANRKLIIDFFDMAPGDYTIKVKKEGTEKAFNYHIEGYGMIVKADASTLASASR